MTRDEMKNRISMALKDPILQQGFEIICKDLAISEHDREHNDYELTEVYKKVEQLEQEKCELLGIIQGKDKAIADLKKENAELKERFERAKEIIKDFVDRDDSCWSIQKRAEEFLKECE